jgi:glycosyltransferase involved in cell wall biosynthesis
MVHRDAPCTGPALGKCLGCASGYYGAPKGIPLALGVRAAQLVARTEVDLFLPISLAVAERTGLAERSVPWQTLPNFLPDDVAAADPDTVVEGLPPDGYVLFVGDAAADKGAEVLLDAHGAIAGAPPLVLMGRVASPRLSPPPANVVVLGPRPHAEVMAAWARCSVAVVPSILPEPFGLVTLEAMATGRPVIASGHGGLTDVVADGESGLLVPPGDARALGAALGLLLADADLRASMGEAGRRRAARFTPAVVLPALEEAYGRVVKAR